MLSVNLIPIDLSKADGHNHPDINLNDRYLAFVMGDFRVGKFSKQWYGFNFDCGWGSSGMQFDAPGTNLSTWKALWRIEGEDATMLLEEAKAEADEWQRQAEIRRQKEDDESWLY